MVRKILLVEDDDCCSDIFSLVVQHLGYETIRATNGMEGVARAAGEQPDLIVMDLMMPEMDGVEATRQIKRKQTTHQVPIVVVTASFDRDRCHAALAAGAAEVLFKPVSIARLRDLLSKYVVSDPGVSEL